MSPLELRLLDALERLHCGALCMGTKDFSAQAWAKDLKRAERALVEASRLKAGLPPATQSRPPPTHSSIAKRKHRHEP